MITERKIRERREILIGVHKECINAIKKNDALINRVEAGIGTLSWVLEEEDYDM